MKTNFMFKFKQRGCKPESWNEIVAGGSNVAGIGEVALVQVVAPSPVPSQALGANPALVVWKLLYVLVLNIFEARSWNFLADIGHTIYSVASVPLKITKTLHKSLAPERPYYYISYLFESQLAVITKTEIKAHLRAWPTPVEGWVTVGVA